MDLLKKIGLALSVALMASSVQADNEVIDLGIISAGDEFTGNGNVAKDIDIDTIEFELTTTLDVSAGGSFFTFDALKAPLMIDFYNGTTLVDSFTVASGDEGSFGPESLSAGNYSFVLSTSNDSGTYSYSVSAVPEPSTYALMLAGLGLVGFMARRRKAA